MILMTMMMIWEWIFFDILEKIHKRLTNKDSENETDHNI